ncbi:hypothetical protein M0811_05653 [Anaeramoeba ignava]|uniref:Transmembrane protein n=1 Tax=Anaeramoeba ignava TaxID=1746090 RepID=A0A9Q0LS64_ANAIG|nr:hypothetical protein M0811_05653 [Anaeramoeba ignava]
MSGIVAALCVSFCFMLAGFIWLGVDQAYLSHFKKTDCKVVDKYLDYIVFQSSTTNCTGYDTLNYQSNFQVTYKVDGTNYEELSCYFGQECRVSKGKSCKVKRCTGIRKNGVCRKYISLKKDFYEKYDSNITYDCWYWKDDPRFSTLRLPRPSYAWSLFFWIPAALICFPFIFAGISSAVGGCSCSKKSHRYDYRPRTYNPPPPKTNVEEPKSITLSPTLDPPPPKDLSRSSDSLSSDIQQEIKAYEDRVKKEQAAMGATKQDEIQMTDQKDIQINYDFSPQDNYSYDPNQQNDYSNQPGPINYNIGNDSGPIDFDPNSNQGNQEF